MEVWRCVCGGGWVGDKTEKRKRGGKSKRQEERKRTKRDRGAEERKN